MDSVTGVEPASASITLVYVRSVAGYTEMVPGIGLEPIRLAAVASKTTVAANYTSRALFGVIVRY